MSLPPEDPEDREFAEALARLSAEPRFASRYRLEARLGRGGMALVARATQVATQRAVAVKILAGNWSPEMGERFVREGRLLAKLRHPHILEVFDFGFLGGSAYLVTELAPGGSLRDELNAKGPMALPRLAATMGPVVSGLAAVHREGIVHRDLKPDNVLFGEDGQPRVADFGLAALVDADRLTATGAFVGSLSYAAPEMIRGETFTPASDIYAIGVILYELLSGRTPFVARTPQMLFKMVVDEPPARISEWRAGLPAEIERTVHLCLAKRPADRPGNAEALAAEIAGWASLEESVDASAAQTVDEEATVRLRASSRPPAGAAASSGVPPRSTAPGRGVASSGGGSAVSARARTALLAGAFAVGCTGGTWLALRAPAPRAKAPATSAAPFALDAAEHASRTRKLFAIGEAEDRLIEEFTVILQQRASFVEEPDPKDAIALGRRARLKRDELRALIRDLRDARDSAAGASADVTWLLAHGVSRDHFFWWLEEECRRFAEGDGPEELRARVDQEGLALRAEYQEAVLRSAASLDATPDPDGHQAALLLWDARGLARAVGFHEWTPDALARSRTASASFLRRLSGAGAVADCVARCWNWGVAGSFRKAERASLEASAAAVRALASKLTRGREKVIEVADTMAREADSRSSSPAPGKLTR